MTAIAIEGILHGFDNIYQSSPLNCPYLADRLPPGFERFALGPVLR
jgi:hypothetical protein